MMKAFAALLAVLLFAGSAQAGAPSLSLGGGGKGKASSYAKTDNVEAWLLIDHQAVAPGQTLEVLFKTKIRPRWHTYWRNPGDSGQATELKWKLPPGWRADAFEWPAPDAIPYEGLVNYGYSGEVAYPLRLTAPANAPSGILDLSASAIWLVCEEICIPEQVEFSVRVNVAAAPKPDTAVQDQIRAARARLPAPLDAGRPAAISAHPDGARLSVSDAALSAALTSKAASDLRFFPYKGDLLDHAKPQKAAFGPGGVSLILPRGLTKEPAKQAADGVLAWREGGALKSAVIRAEPGSALPQTDATPLPAAGFGPGGGSEANPKAAASPPASEFTGGLLTAALFAFFGGLILNLMPCVFPVLFVKALSLAKSAHEPAKARRDGLFFLVGCLASFAVLAAALIALRAGGEAIGWGFQLQEPWLVGVLALLFFAVGLNLMGVFEIGTSVQNVGSGLAAKSGPAGAFFTGVLAVVAASPCTAPFMGGALGYALTQPALSAAIVFLALGLGFAAPFAALSFAPRLLKRLPKPGAWMERFKQALAFPMFATSVFFIWVLSALSGQTGVALSLLAGLALVFLIWAFKAWKGLAGRAVALALVGGLAASAYAAIAEKPAALVSKPWSAEAVAAERAAGRPVFVNFTADWCISCKVNERTALASPKVARAFEQANVAYFKGDWTARDSVIAAELARYGRAGVPLYLFYRPAGSGEGEPEILPQILQEKDLVDRLAKSPSADEAG